MYAKIKDGQVESFPYSIETLRKENPDTSFPFKIPDEILVAYGIHVVVPDPVPECNRMVQTITTSKLPVNENGMWVLKHTVGNKSLEDAETRVRSERDRLLREGDWEIVKASEARMRGNPAASPATAILDYRQALRDITNQVGFPFIIEWPVKP